VPEIFCRARFCATRAPNIAKRCVSVQARSIKCPRVPLNLYGNFQAPLFLPRVASSSTRRFFSMRLAGMPSRFIRLPWHQRAPQRDLLRRDPRRWFSPHPRHLRRTGVGRARERHTAAWRFQRPWADLNLPEVESLEETEFLAPPRRLITDEDRHRHR
jgi:hypothetical protein